MRYKNKNLIVEDIGPEPNCNYPVEVGHYYSKIEELDEVYRKAEAFDAVIEASENIDNHIDFTEAIDEIVIRHKGCHL